jgi:fibronectin-binding autotransporter adhesin
MLLELTRQVFCCMSIEIMIPNIRNNFEFERIKAPKINDRKRHCIELILRRLRSLICWQLSCSSNSKLFLIFGMSKNVFLFAFLFYTSSLISTTAQWTGTTDGAWLTGTNWNPNTIPSMSGDTANLTNASPANTTLSLGGLITLQTLNLDLAAGYTINPGGGSFRFQGTSSSALNVTTVNGNGANTISAPIAIITALTITQNSSLPLTLSGALTGTVATNLAGSGTVVLSTDNSGYSGQISINGGTLSISNDNNLGLAGTALNIGNGTLLASTTLSSTRPITLTGTAGIQAAPTFTATMGGLISGTGSLNISDTGTVVLSNSNNSYLGGTTVTAGTLSVSNDGNLGNSAGAINLGNGTLSLSFSTARSGTVFGNATITSGSSLTLSGNFSGAGSLTFAGGGTFTLTGSNSYIGGTTIATGTQLTGTTNGIQGDITLNTVSSELSFNQSFDGTYTGILTSAVAGAGVLTKQGSSTLTLTNNSPAFDGTTEISAGTLIVNGSLLNSSFTVDAGATLGGTGTIGATTSQGIINPGTDSTVGTLSINGTLTLNGSSEVQINLSPVSADLIAVNNTATLNNSLLSINPIAGFYGFAADYTILTTTNRVGTFAAPTSSNASFVPSLTYTATSVLLHVQISEPFAIFPFSNFNTAAVGNNIDALSAADQIPSDLLSVFNGLIGESFSTINEALDQLHPAPYSALTEMQSELGGQLISLFHRSPFLACCCAKPNRIWVEPFGNSLTLKRHGLEIGAQANSGGVAIGYDGQISENFVLGVGGAWNRSHLKWHDHRGHSDVDGVYGGVYFDSQKDNFYIGGSCLIGTDFYDTSRHIRFLTTNRKAKATYQALDIMAQIATAYLFGSPQAFFYPYANLDYLYLNTEEFTESGAGSLDLTVKQHTDTTLRTEMGLGLQVQDTNAAETVCISPLISIGWVNMAPLHRPLLKSNFIGTTIPFSVRGWDETWNLLNANIGLTTTYRCFRLSLQYNAELSPNKHTTFFNQHGNIHFDWKW